jgi:hypothetical protein
MSQRCPFEHIQNPDLETKQIAETTDLMVELLKKRYPLPEELLKFLSKNYPESIRTLRGVHPKSNGCVKATFTIDPYIPDDIQVGLFANPGQQFDAFIRFSNATAVVGPDTAVNPDTQRIEHGSRGMAIKVLDVGGEVLIDDNGKHNQDFLMINQPMFAFANTEDYLRLERVLERDNDAATKFFALLQLQNPEITEEQRRNILILAGVKEDEDISKEDEKQIVQRVAESLRIVSQIIQTTDVGNPLGIQYFSAAPFLFGSDRVMKFSAKPCDEVHPISSPEPLTDNYLRDALTETVNGKQSLSFDFMLQIRRECEDFGENMESIENASEEWKESDYPFIKVAKIFIPLPQSEVDFEENVAHCERLAFTPWHSLVEHQPIGSINRLRKDVYAASAKHRETSTPESDLSQKGNEHENN